MEGLVHGFTVDGLVIQYWMVWVTGIIVGFVAWDLWNNKQPH